MAINVLKLEALSKKPLDKWVEDDLVYLLKSLPEIVNILKSTANLVTQINKEWRKENGFGNS